MRIRMAITCMLFVHAVPGIAVKSVHAEKAVLDLPTIFASYHKQERAVKSAKFEINARQTCILQASKPKTQAEVLGFLAPRARAVRSEEFEIDKLSPEENSQSSYQITIIFGGKHGACRITTNRPMFDWTTSTFLSSNSDTTFDGIQSRAMFTREDSPVAHGVINKSIVKNQDVQVVGYKPLFFAFRAFDTDYIGNPVSAYDVANSKENVPRSTNTVCLKSGPRELWLDTANGNSIYKYLVRQASGGIFRSVKVTKTEKNGVLWIPMKWECTYFDFNGMPESHVEYSVENYQLNPSLPSDAFQLKFPPGTEIIENGETSDGSNEQTSGHLF